MTKYCLLEEEKASGLLNHKRVCVSRCWLSTENHFIWSFIGPACLIILVRSDIGRGTN